MSPFSVLALLRPSTPSVTRMADACRLANSRVQCCTAFSSAPTAMVFSAAGKPGNGSCSWVPVRKSMAAPLKFSVPSALATGVPFR